MLLVRADGAHRFLGSPEGFSRSLDVVDVTDPAGPTRRGSFRGDHDVVDVALAGTHAYVATRGSGLRVLDLGDPSAPKEVGGYGSPARLVEVGVLGRHAYVAGAFYDGSGGVWWGVRVLDLADPLSPRATALAPLPGNATDGSGGGQVAVAEPFICLSQGTSGLLIFRQPER